MVAVVAGRAIKGVQDLVRSIFRVKLIYHPANRTSRQNERGNKKVTI